MWDYAQMAHIAKECGGPELFMQGLVETGRSQMEPIIYATGGAGLLLGLTFGIAGCLVIKKRIDDQKKLNTIQYEVLEQMAEVEKELSRRLTILESESENTKNEMFLQDRVIYTDISKLQPSEDILNSINDFDLKGLVEAYRKHEVMKPIMVYNRKSYYEILAGARRWRAAQIAGLTKVPILVFEDEKEIERRLMEECTD